MTTTRRTAAAALGFLLLLTAGLATLRAGPNRYGHSDRVERHMLPAVSSGPMDPAWSPDGRWIAFSMRGDLWKVPAEGGGEAVALTEGPTYHFEPAWSPDGRSLALSMDSGDGNLDIGVVSAEGGAVRRVTIDPAVDVEPAWSADGGALYFTSARGRGGFAIWRQGLGADGGASADTAVRVVPGIQPAVSPDGHRLAYVEPVRGRQGSGGLWVKDLPDGEPRLVRFEESEYRMKPEWTADGSSILYVSDEAGSDDVRIVSVDGGGPVVLTPDAPGHEFSPTPSPDGRRFAFVSNRSGPTTLYTVEIGGGPFPSWDVVPITSRRGSGPEGALRIEVTGPDGGSLPARIQLLASDGRAYAPEAAAGGFHRVISVTETHYFHAGGPVEVRLPAGAATVEAVHGFEYRPASVRVEVPADGSVTARIRLDRIADLPARGWYSGDTHVHDLHQGRYGLGHQAFFEQLQAEDLHVTNALIHMDGTRLMGRWEDLTGAPSLLSTPDHILQYAQEFRGSLGHIALLGIRTFQLPLIAGAPGTAYEQPTLDYGYLDAAREQGGIAGFPHPYLVDTSTPEGAGTTLIPVDVALGRGDYYDVASVYSDELHSAAVYHRLLDAGFHLAATGGTDNFSDVWRDPPPGTSRTYVHLEGGPLSVEHWLEGVREQHTFASTGPLLFLDVDGHGPGDEIRLDEGAAAALPVRAEATSIAPMSRLDIFVNGEVAASVTAERDSTHLAFDGMLAVPEGGWVAAQVVGPPSRYVADSYAFAHTSPVYVVRGGRPWRSAEDARFLAAAVDAAWARAQDGPWRSDEERARFEAGIHAARAVYERIAEQASDPAGAERAHALLLRPDDPEWTRPSPPMWRARFVTTRGSFIVEVTRADGPIGADRFYDLVRLGYYDDTRFHRVRDGYIAQLGIHGDPAVNAAWQGRELPDDPARGSNVRGTFAFAAAPGGNGRNTQIYFNLGDNRRNDHEGFQIFGRVVGGVEVLDRLYAGYGERSGSGVRQGLQGPLMEGGNAFIDRAWPRLDRVVRASIVP